MSPQNLTQRFRTVCLQRLELPELCHRRNERPSPGFAKGDHHQCLPRHRLLCSGKHRILHNAQRVRSPGLRGSRSGESISPIHYLSFLLDFCWPAVWAFCISDTCRCGPLNFWRSEWNSSGLVKVPSVRNLALRGDSLRLIYSGACEGQMPEILSMIQVNWWNQVSW